MTDFEKVMEKSAIEYLSAGIADMQFLWPKMQMTGQYIGKAPAFIQVGKAPYDMTGYFLDGARTIACEVKENGERKTSLAIQAPDKDGTGLKYHQLEALVRVHQAGGLASVVWNNGGEIGYLEGTRLVAAKAAMDTSLKAQKLGMPNAKEGRRSILWGNFVPVKVNGQGVPLWLPVTK